MSVDLLLEALADDRYAVVRARALRLQALGRIPSLTNRDARALAVDADIDLALSVLEGADLHHVERADYCFDSRLAEAAHAIERASETLGVELADPAAVALLLAVLTDPDARALLVTDRGVSR